MLPEDTRFSPRIEFFSLSQDVYDLELARLFCPDY